MNNLATRVSDAVRAADKAKRAWEDAKDHLNLLEVFLAESMDEGDRIETESDIFTVIDGHYARYAKD